MSDEDHGEWRPQGDFYAEPDDLVRGVTISAAPLPGPPSSTSIKGLSDGDFYCEPLDTHKDYDYSMPSSMLETHTARFAPASTPPQAPTDLFFKLELTTLIVRSSSPHEIGNVLLDFFENQVVSTLHKVNHTKFSLKADVFEKCIMSTLKVRVFHQESSQFAIEFQRRRGDVVIFNSTYQKASQYFMQTGLEMVKGVADQPRVANFAQPPLPIQRVSDVGEADLTPLLDMAGYIGMPRLQAEAAVALAGLAEEEPIALQLCTARGFRELLALLNSSSSVNEVAYPTARLANILAHRREAAPHIAEQGILQLMLDQVRSKTTCALVRDELSQALKAATQWQSATTLSQTQLLQLAHALNECSREIEGTVNPMVVQNLRSARMAISSQ